MLPSMMLLGALVACSGDEGYRVVVHLPGDRARATLVEVSVLGSCGEIGAQGEEPVAPFLQVETGGEQAPPLGSISEGLYGLYGRAWQDCRLYAAGCDGFRADGGGGGTIEVFLAEIPIEGCDEGERCVEDRCEPLEDACDRSSCDDCLACVREEGDCSEEEARCAADTECVAISLCVGQCDRDEDCQLQCSLAHPDGAAAYEEALSCFCRSCVASCEAGCK